MADALDTAPLEPLLGYQLALAEVPARRVFQRHVGAPMDLRPVEFSALVLLLANPGAAPRQLGAALNLPPPQVSVLLDRLAGRGLLERRKCPTDGRAQQLWLTPAGQALAQRAHAVSRTMEDGLLSALSAAERAMLRELLVKLARGAAAA